MRFGVFSVYLGKICASASSTVYTTSLSFCARFSVLYEIYFGFTVFYYFFVRFLIYPNVPLPPSVNSHFLSTHYFFFVLCFVFVFFFLLGKEQGSSQQASQVEQDKQNDVATPLRSFASVKKRSLPEAESTDQSPSAKFVTGNIGAENSESKSVDTSNKASKPSKNQKRKMKKKRRKERLLSKRLVNLWKNSFPLSGVLLYYFQF